MTCDDSLPKSVTGSPDFAPAEPASSDSRDAGLGSDRSDGAPVEDAPSKGAPKGGAPALNTNRQTAGLFGDPGLQAVRFELGGLPPSMSRVERQARKFRAVLEQATVAAHGEISVLHAMAIQTAARHERHGLLAMRWLREHADALKPGEKLSLSKAAADASAARDKAVDRLKLDASDEDVDAFYAHLRAGAFDVAPEPAPSSAGQSEPQEPNEPDQVGQPGHADHATRAGDEFRPGFGARLDQPPDSARTSPTPMQDAAARPAEGQQP
jgi:hypothetical protein